MLLNQSLEGALLAKIVAYLSLSVSTGSCVSQCQLIYSVITMAISLILGLNPAEMELLMCFCHIESRHYDTNMYFKKTYILKKACIKNAKISFKPNTKILYSFNC